MVKAANSGELVLFVGSGLSCKLGLPNWVELSCELIEYICKETTKADWMPYVELVKSRNMRPLDVIDRIKSENSLVRRYIKNRMNIDFSNITSNQLINHTKLIAITRKIITTNYDKAFENAIGAGAKVITPEMPFEIINMRDEYIYKIHGCISNVDKCVLYSSDYKKVYEKQNSIVEQSLTSLLPGNSMLFVGFSLSDPYIVNILKYINRIYKGYQPMHYILTTNAEEFKEFKDIVRPVIIDSYSQLPNFGDDLLRESKTVISRKSKSKMDSGDTAKPLLRRRCRVLPAKCSREFYGIVNFLYTGNGANNFNHGRIQKSIANKLTDPFEKNMALATYLEIQGAIEQMRDLLIEMHSAKGELDLYRRLLLAIAHEKIDELQSAEEELNVILRNVVNDKLLLAAQFNLCVCGEKKNNFKENNFTRFIEMDTENLLGKERLKDKAIGNQLILCIRSNNKFFGDYLIDESLEYEKIYSPIGYVKNLLMYKMYCRELMTDEECFDVIKVIDQDINVNSKVAAYSRLIKFGALNDELKTEIINKLHEIVDKTRSKSVEKHVSDLLELF